MVKKFAASLAGLTREQISGGALGAGAVSLAVGVGVVAGVGFGFIALGVCLVGIALLLGWTS